MVEDLVIIYGSFKNTLLPSTTSQSEIKASFSYKHEWHWVPLSPLSPVSSPSPLSGSPRPSPIHSLSPSGHMDHPHYPSTTPATSLLIIIIWCKGTSVKYVCSNWRVSMLTLEPPDLMFDTCHLALSQSIIVHIIVFFLVIF